MGLWLCPDCWHFRWYKRRWEPWFQFNHCHKCFMRHAIVCSTTLETAIKEALKEETQMALIKANPNAEVSVAFPTFKVGTYDMRIKAVEDRNPEKNDLKITLEYTNPSQLVTIDDQAFTKSLEAAGSLFDYVQLAEDKQWKLRTLTEACGLPWGDYDPTVDLIGCDVVVQVKLEEYQGEQKNKVGRYVIPKK